MVHPGCNDATGGGKRGCALGCRPNKQNVWRTEGKRETPAPVPTLSPLRAEAVTIMTDAVRRDRLSIAWDTHWQPIRESAACCDWRAWPARRCSQHVQQALSASNSKDIGLGPDFAVLYLRAQCAHQHRIANDKLNSSLNLVA